MIQNLFNSNGFYWFVGVVEDRMDDMQAGRCRVRIFGDHTSDKELLPTSDLPWAIPMQPITSAALSGKGHTPMGPLEGTWVVGFYLDGPDKQIPMMIGTIGASSISGGFAAGGADRPDLSNPAEESAKEKADAAAKQNPDDGPVDPAAPIRKSVNGWTIGQTTAKYESGNRGPGTINPYTTTMAGDLGGASYGMYQFASNLPPIMPNGKHRPSTANSLFAVYLRETRFKSYFSGLKPATPDFDAAWKKVAAEKSEEFKQEQHDFIYKHSYLPMIAKLKAKGLDLSKYGPAVQDLVWGSAVMANGITSYFTEPLKGKASLTEADIVNLVIDYKIANIKKYYQSSPPDLQQKIVKRWQKERVDLLKLAT